MNLRGFVNSSLLAPFVYITAAASMAAVCGCRQRTPGGIMAFGTSGCLIAKQTVWVIFLDRGVIVQLGCSPHRVPAKGFSHLHFYVSTTGPW